MIIGIGIDIIEIERIKQAIGSNDNRFIFRVFTENEIVYCRQKKNAAPYFAGHFAAKEALLKALGTGLRQISWQDIEIKHNALGKPYPVFSTGLDTQLKAKHIQNIHISISHSRDYAVAQAILEA